MDDQPLLPPPVSAAPPANSTHPTRATNMPNGRIKFRHLQCFLAVTQFGSVQRAANSLSITQPAVSKTIAELESIQLE